MANLRIFVSSTCYDLQTIRGQLRDFLSGAGYEPVMSEYSDVIFDPQIHTHTSCLREVANCDMLVLVLGSRFGGTILPKALENLDITNLSEISHAESFQPETSALSITQAEVLQAINCKIPVFAFVDAAVMQDHKTYEKNKNKEIITQIEFSSIEKIATAPYIFEFINFLRHRIENNSVYVFSRFDEIEQQLKKQWGGLFQRLLVERRDHQMEGRRIENLSSQISDLKAAVLGSISNANLKETAKGAIRFRQMIEFVGGLVRAPKQQTTTLNLNLNWNDLIRELGIVDIFENDDKYGSYTILRLEDSTFFQSRIPIRALARLANDWLDFTALSNESKSAIIEAVSDSLVNRRTPPIVRYVNSQYANRLSTNDIEDDFDEPKSSAQILFTAEELIKRSTESYLKSVREFRNRRFMVESSDRVLRVALLPSSDGKAKNFKYNYAIPENGNLADELERLHKLLSKDIFVFLSSEKES